MTKFISNLELSRQNAQSLWLDKRLLKVNIDQQELEAKVEQKENEELPKLSAKIAALEAQGKSKQEIKTELQKEKQRLFKEAVNQYLKEKKIKMTYDDLVKDPTNKKMLEDSQQRTDQKLSPQIDKFVDDYYTQKAVKSGAISGALRSIPAATSKQDLESTNPEIQRLQQLRADREKVLQNSQRKRTDILQDESLRYKKTTSEIDNYTSPDSNYDHGIKDYDDGVFGKATDYDNPTRNRLNGYLYANYIFMGGGETGLNAVQNRVEEAYKHYHSTFFDSRFTMTDLTQKMGMNKYLQNAESYSKNDRVVGMMAGLLKLLDDNVKDPTTHKRYEDYLRLKFDEVKVMGSEEQQIQELFKIKAISEFLNVAPDWKREWNRIDKMTDPTVDGAKIDDYPGTFDANKNNKTRWQLNGFLYSQYIFFDHKGTKVDAVFDEAANMYTNYGGPGKSFEQEFLEQVNVYGNPKEKGFGLQDYLKEADTFTKYEQPKGVVAGLLKLATENLSGEKQKNYLQYLRIRFALLSQFDSEESQLMFLSATKSPDEAINELNEELRVGLLDLMIESAKQHNQFKFTNPDIIKFQDDKSATLDAKTHVELSGKARSDMEKFILERSDKAMKEKLNNKDNPDGLMYKYKLLVENNKKLTQPVLSDADLDVLRKSVEDLNKQFDEARAIGRITDFKQAVVDKYLEKLSNAEKVYFDRAAELDEKLKTVEQAAATPKNPTNIKGGAPTGPGVVPLPGEKEPDKDVIEQEWSKAKQVEPAMKDYTGAVVINTAKANARDDDGKIITTFTQGTELFRTAADADVKGKEVTYEGKTSVFVRVSNGENKYWISEKLLTLKAEQPTPVTPEPPKEKPPVTPEKPPVAPNGFQRIKDEVESNPYGSVFEIFYNGKMLPLRLQKMPDGYHLMYRTPDVEGNIVFPNSDEVQKYIDSGRFYQYLNTQMLQNPEIWDRYKDTSWVDKAVKVERRGPYNVFVELDWARNQAFETGNVKCEFDVAPDGRINYRLEKDYIGPRGENVRTGFVSDFFQLIEMLSHCKQWSENYLGRKESDEFPAVQYHEQMLTALMDGRNFDMAGTRIGEKYYFQNFYNQEYSYMELNWDQQQGFYARNESKNNPRLEVKLNPDNSITYRLTNHTGAGGTRMGCFGTVQSFDMLIAAVEAVRKNPLQYMTVPVSNIPVLPEYPLA